MKISRKILPLLLSVAVWASCSKENRSQVPQTAPENEEIADLSFASKGAIIVQFDDEMLELIETDLEAGFTKATMTKSSELNSVLSSLNIEDMTRVFPYDEEWEPRHREAGLHRFYKVTFSKSIPVTKAQASFDDFPGVISTEPILKMQTCAIFNDPYYSTQWHYYNDGHLTSSAHKAGCDINVVPVWEQYTTGNSNVIVGVVDGGIQTNHPDLADNYAGGKNFAASVTGHNYIVAHNHGTHVAGTIGAVNNNSTGVCGIAGGDKKNGVAGVRLLSAQIFEDNPSNPNSDYQGDAAQAITWACDNGAVIAQNSWGYSFDTEAEARRYNINSVPSLKTAIDYFIKNAGRNASGVQTGPMDGGVVIFAAGNDAFGYDVIGSYDAVISVGSLAPNFNRAYYSNYGDWVDICAPGGDQKLNSTYGGVRSTLKNSSYGWYQGTSMACPHVSGAAALIVSYFGGPGFTNEMLKDILLTPANANQATVKTQKIGPMLDVYASFQYGIELLNRNTPPAAVKSIDLMTTYTTITATFKVTEDKQDGKATGYKVMLASSEDALTSIPDFNSIPNAVTVKDVLSGDKNVGENVSTIFTGLAQGGTYYVAAVAYDSEGEYSELSPVASVQLGTNTAPVVSLSHTSVSVSDNGTFAVTATVSDPDGHTFTTDFTAGSAAASIASNGSGRYTITIDGSKAQVGTYQAVLKATDQFGAEASATLTYKIMHNNAPVITLAKTSITLKPSDVETVEATVSDPDGDSFTLNFTPGSDAASISKTAEGTYTITLRAKKASSGTYAAVIKATDNQGTFSEATLTYTISPNNPPVVTLGATSVSVKSNGTETVSATITDPEGDSFSTDFTPGSDAATLSRNNDGTYTITIRGQRASAGTYTATLKATDNLGAEASASLEYTIEPNEAPERVTDLAFTASGNSASASFSVTSDPESGKASGYLVLLAKTRAELSINDYANPPANLITRTVNVGSRNVGDKITVNFTDLDYSQDYFAAVVGYDAQSAYSALSNIASARTATNNPPVVSFSQQSVTVKSFETITLDATVSDPEGHTFTTDFTPGSGAATISPNGTGKFRITINGNNASAGTYSATLKATDKYGAAGSAKLTYTILPNTPPQKVTDLKVTATDNNLRATFSVTSDAESVRAEGYRIFMTKKRYDLNYLDFSNVPASVDDRTIAVGYKNVGETLAMDYTDLEFDTNYYLAVVGYDNLQLYSTLSDVVTVRTAKNNPPVITVSKSNVSIAAHEKETVNVTVSDPDGHDFEVVEPQGSAFVTVQRTGAGVYSVYFNGPAASGVEQSGILTFRATDRYGEQATSTITYKIAKNNKPVYKGGMVDVVLVQGETLTLDLGKYFSEPDGEILDFAATQGEQVLSLKTNGATATLTAASTGLTVVTVSASDSFGAKAEGTFKVLVRSANDEVFTNYPNPIAKTLYVSTRSASSEMINVVVSNANGKTVVNKSVEASAFDPAQIDLGSCAPGRYVLTVSGKDGKYTKNIVKK